MQGVSVYLQSCQTKSRISGSLEPQEQAAYCDCQDDVGAVVTYFRNPRPQEASHQIFESLKLCLYDYESKVCLWIHIACHLFDLVDLCLDTGIDALQEAIVWPADAIVSGEVIGNDYMIDTREDGRTNTVRT